MGSFSARARARVLFKAGEERGTFFPRERADRRRFDVKVFRLIFTTNMELFRVSVFLKKNSRLERIRRKEEKKNSPR